MGDPPFYRFSGACSKESIDICHAIALEKQIMQPNGGAVASIVCKMPDKIRSTGLTRVFLQ